MSQQQEGEEEAVLGSLNATLARKKAEKYDHSLDAELRTWLGTQLGLKVFDDQGKSLQELLMDGVHLCNLLNTLAPGTIKRVNSSSLSFKQMENVTNFIRGTKRLGLPESECFSTLDLFEDKDMPVVLTSLDGLRKLVARDGLEALRARALSGVLSPGMRSPTSTRSPARKWGTPPASPATSSPASPATSSPATDSPSSFSSAASASPASSPFGGTESRSKSSATIAVPSLEDDVRTKEEFKYNPVLEQAVRNWLSAVLKVQLDPDVPFPQLIKPGVLLCQLVNTMKPDTIKKIHNSSIAFRQIENISNYIKACIDDFGLRESDMFQVNDLYREKNLTIVIQQLHGFARHLQREGYPVPNISSVHSSRSLWASSLVEGEVPIIEATATELSETEKEILDWTNTQLARRDPPDPSLQAANLSSDMQNGVRLLELCRVVTNYAHLGGYIHDPTTLWQYMQNASMVIRFIESQTFENVTVCTSADVVRGNTTAIARLIRYLRDHFDLEFLFMKVLREQGQVDDTIQQMGVSALLGLDDDEVASSEDEDDGLTSSDESSSDEEDDGDAWSSESENEDVLIEAATVSPPLPSVATVSTTKKTPPAGAGATTTATATATATAEVEAAERRREVEREREAEMERQRKADSAVQSARQREAEERRRNEATVSARQAALERERAAAAAEQRREKEAAERRARAEEAARQAIEQRRAVAEKRRAEAEKAARAAEEKRRLEAEQRREQRLAAAREAEAARRREAEKRRHEAEERLRREEEQRQRQRQLEMERYRAQEEERRKQREAEAQRLREEAEQRERERAAEVERQLAEEAERQRKRQEEAERRQREAEEAQRREAELARQEEEQKRRREAMLEEVERRAAEKARQEAAERLRQEKERRAREEAELAEREAEEERLRAAELARLEKVRAAQAAEVKRLREEAARIAAEEAARRKEEAERLAREEQRWREEEAARLAAEKERLLREEAEREQAEALRLAQEAEQLAHEEAQRVRREEVERLASEEAERLKREEEERLAREEAERIKHEAEERLKREEAERLRREEEERLEREERDRLAAPPAHEQADEPGRTRSGTGEQQGGEVNAHTLSVSGAELPVGEQAILPPKKHRKKHHDKKKKKRHSKKHSKKTRDGKSNKTKLHRSHSKPSTSTLPTEEPPTLRRNAMLDNNAMAQITKAQAAVRARIAKEVLSTELSYIRSIKSLIQHLVEPLRASPNITDRQVRQVCLNVPELLRHHIKFVTPLQRRVEGWSDSSVLGDIFLNETSFIPEYVEYITHYNQAHLRIRALASRYPEFNSIVEAFEHKQKQISSLNLESFLIMPVQRIPRYVLLLRDLRKYTPKDTEEHENLGKAMNQIQGYLDDINRQCDTAQSERVLKMIAVSNAVDGEVHRFLDANRDFVLEDSLKIKSIKPVKQADRASLIPDRIHRLTVSLKQSAPDAITVEDSHWYLFNDVLVCAQPKQEDPQNPHQAHSRKTVKPYTLTHALSLTSMRSCQVSKKKNNVCQFTLDLGHEVWTVEASSPTRKHEWVNEINRLRALQKDLFLKQTFMV